MTLPESGLSPEHAGPPRLLVSVRTEREAIAALEGGADVIDIKEPSNGPLGAAPADVRRGIARACAGRGGDVLLSAAAGELREYGDPGSWTSIEGVALVKLGLSGCACLDWRAGLERWAAALASRPARSSLVAAAYADHGEAGAPPPAEVLAHAAALGLGVFLIDTFDKAGGRLRSRLSDGEIADLIGAAREAGIAVTLAGSLDAGDFPSLAALGPAVLAVRGAACRGFRRDGEVDPARVAALAAACRGSATARRAPATHP